MYRSPKIQVDCGQILPLSLSLLVLGMTVVFHHGFLWFESISKMKLQRTADTQVLTSVNNVARSLNAIAGINEGLEIVRTRVIIFTLTLHSLRACAAITLGASPCFSAWRKLEQSSHLFFKRINRLSSILADQQDQIASWGRLSLYEGTTKRFDISSSRDHISWIYPPKEKFNKLPIYRDQKINSVYQGVLASVPVTLAAPYVLEPTFSSHKNKFTFGLAHRPYKNPFQTHIDTIRSENPYWIVAEAHVKGRNLSKMGFYGQLSKVSQLPELWKELTYATSLRSRFVKTIPEVSNFARDLRH